MVFCTIARKNGNQFASISARLYCYTVLLSSRVFELPSIATSRLCYNESHEATSGAVRNVTVCTAVHDGRSHRGTRCGSRQINIIRTRARKPINFFVYRYSITPLRSFFDCVRIRLSTAWHNEVLFHLRDNSQLQYLGTEYLRSIFNVGNTRCIQYYSNFHKILEACLAIPAVSMMEKPRCVKRINSRPFQPAREHNDITDGRRGERITHIAMIPVSRTRFLDESTDLMWCLLLRLLLLPLYVAVVVTEVDLKIPLSHAKDLAAFLAAERRTSMDERV
jgi:hypothetical protein